MSRDGPDRTSPLDAASLEQLLQRLRSTDIDELEVAQGDARIYIRREPGWIEVGPAPPPSGVPVEEDHRFTVAAPLTGVFYGRPSPEQAPFVSLGETVEAGQVVALIETMKLFNEVITEVAGEVVQVNATEGELVEVGQSLYLIRPSERGDGT